MWGAMGQGEPSPGSLPHSDNEPEATRGDNEAAWDVPVRFALGLVAAW